MGEAVTRKPVQPAGQNQGGTDPRPGTGTRPGETCGNPGTPAPGTGTPAPAGTGTGPRAGTQTEEKKPAGLSSVNPAAPVPEAPKKQTKRKKSAPKKKTPDSFNADQISALIMSASAIVASRPGMEVFMLRPEEANQLATPLANMIEKSEKLQSLGEHADALSLVTASLVIFAPRVLVYSDQQKKKKLERNGGVQLVEQKGKSSGGSNRTDGKPVADRPAHAEKHVSSALDAIPPVL